MNAPQPSVKGWCPGVLRPMRTGDGLIARIRPRGGALPAEALFTLARATEELGNGLADLTSQANIQLRGLDEAGAAALAERLAPLGLLDADAQSEARRNIIVSPLHGLDPSRLIDIAPLAEELAERLRTAQDLAGLPAKFTFLIDDGGALPLGGTRADVRFEALRGAGGTQFLVKLRGDSANARAVGLCAPEASTETAIQLARGAALASLAQDHAGATRAAAGADDCLTHFDCVNMHFLGALAPYGRVTATMLDALVDAARASAQGEIRLTPWRAVLVPCSAAQSTALRARLANAGFIVAPGDPRARVAACVGAPACASATTDVRGDADFFAPALRRAGSGIELHVSGCAKGCAHQGAARVTLVGRDGRYDLVRNGAAQAAAAAEQGLTRGAARARLAQIFAQPDIHA